MKVGARSKRKNMDREKPSLWELRLYVAGMTSRSLTAINNLKKICEEHLKGKYHIEVVDLLKNPRLAKGEQIIAVPTLIRKLPPSCKKIIGDFSNTPTSRVLVGLDLLPKTSKAVTRPEGSRSGQRS